MTWSMNTVAGNSAVGSSEDFPSCDWTEFVRQRPVLLLLEWTNQTGWFAASNRTQTWDTYN
jgi:hypothetical protein